MPEMMFLVMTVDNKIRDEKVQYDINREAAKISGLVFEKQTKNGWRARQKQIEATEEHGKQLVKSNAFAEKEEQNISLDKRKETFYNEKLHNSVNFQNLVHQIKSPTKDINCNDFIDADTLFDDIKCKKVRFEDVENNQVKLE